MSTDLILDTYKLLRKVKMKVNNKFSGIGLVVYNSKSFNQDNHCDLRPNIKCPRYHITDDKTCDYLLKISDYNHTLHDGFHMVDENGYLRHVAQYFVPPVVKSLKPNQEHGVRLYSSMCGSLLEGILFIGSISSDKNIFIFQEGKYVNIDSLEEMITHEYEQKIAYL